MDLWQRIKFALSNEGGFLSALISAAAPAIVGGIASSLFGPKQSGTVTKTTKTDPRLDPYLFGQSGIFPQAQKLFLQGPKKFFPGQTFADFSPERNLANQLTAQRALQGSPSVGQAIQANLPLAQGSQVANPFATGQAFNPFATGQGINPFLDAQFAAASDAVTRRFQDTVFPTISSAFGRGGRLGSAAQARTQGIAQENLGRTLTNLAGNIYAPAFERERARQFGAIEGNLGRGLQGLGLGLQTQLGALGLAPRLATVGQQLDFANLAQLRDVGQQSEAQRQRQINEDIARFNFQQNAPLQNLRDYASIIQKTTPLAGSQTSQPYFTNPVGSFLGGASAGLGLYGAIKRAGQQTSAPAVGSPITGFPGLLTPSQTANPFL